MNFIGGTVGAGKLMWGAKGLKGIAALGKAKGVQGLAARVGMSGASGAAYDLVSNQSQEPTWLGFLSILFLNMLEYLNH